MFRLTTYLEVARTLEHLAYLGFNIRYTNQLAAIKVTRDRRIDLQEKCTSRSVIYCHVIGPKDVGKTAFIQSFVGRNLKVDIFLINCYVVYSKLLH